MINADHIKERWVQVLFYSNENDEPQHVHVQKGNAEGKLWLAPKLEIVYMFDFTNAEVKQIAVISFEYLEQFKRDWNGYFNK